MVQEKLSKIQLALKAPKSQYNSFGKYSYRSCEDIYEAAKKVVNSLGCVLRLTDDIYETQTGRTFIKATAILEDPTETEERNRFIVVNSMAEIPLEKKGMDQSQISGAASSYARKYALGGLFLLDDNKDADALPPPEKTEKPTTAKRQPPKCEVCGELLEPYVSEKNGETISPDFHAMITQRKYGKTICYNCIKKGAM